MTLKATVFAAVAALCVSAGTAQAQTQGILTCQIGLSQFAEDIYASKVNLRPAQLAAAAKLVEVSRSQCRSGPDLVAVNVQTMRQDLQLATGRRLGSRFDDFWPASPDELAQLTK